MTEKMPIKTLRLNRETVKRLAVRTSVRTGMADPGTGAQSSGLGVKSRPGETISCFANLSGAVVIDPIIVGG